MRAPLHFIKTATLAVIATALLSACATQSNKDPLEGMNRGIYKFNDVADKAVVKPIAGAYKAVLPDSVRSGVNNFFYNLGEVVTVINDLLQFKFDKAMTDAGRFAINSTFGLAGVIDWASKDGIERNREDFGQTLATWGWSDSAYLVLPLLGPSTVRDTGGLVMDSWAFDPIGYVDEPRVRNTLIITKFVDRRAQYLPGSDLLDEAALDPYLFMRDAYLQRRGAQIMDGENSDEVDSESAELDEAEAVVAAAPAR